MKRKRNSDNEEENTDDNPGNPKKRKFQKSKSSFEIGVEEMEKKNYDKAIEHFSDFIKNYMSTNHNNDILHSFYKRALCYRRKGMIELALLDLTKIIEFKNVFPFPLGSYEVRFDFSFNNDRGEIRARKGDFEGAIKDLTVMIKNSPNEDKYYFKRAGYYAGNREFEKSLNDFGKALELNPKNSNYYLSRGYLYESRLKEFNKALEDYNKAIELNPGNHNVYLYRGVLLRDYFSSPFKAMEDFNFVIENNTNKEIGSFAYNCRGNLFYKCFKNYECALIDYEKAIEMDEKNWRTYYNRSTLMYSDNYADYEAALWNINKAIEYLNEDKKGCLYKRSLIFIHLKRYNEALRDISTEIKKHPNDGSFFHLRGDIYKSFFKKFLLAIIDYSKAKEHAKGIIRLNAIERSRNYCLKKLKSKIFQKKLSKW